MVGSTMNDSGNAYVQEIMKVLSQQADSDYAEWSKAYLRNQFEFIGIRAPIRRKFMKQVIKEHGLPKGAELKQIVFSLWELPEREYQQAALDLLEMGKKVLTADDLSWLSTLIVKKSWWETVDVLAPRIFGQMLLENPELVPIYPDKWIEDENFWLQRSAIIYQLKYKEKTDEERLFRNILRRAESNEFFIQKAIGWALREYAKTEPDHVRDFVSKHPLKPLSKREALKHLAKNPR